MSKNNIEIKIKPMIRVPRVRKPTYVHEDKRLKNKHGEITFNVDETDMEHAELVSDRYKKYKK